MYRGVQAVVICLALLVTGCWGDTPAAPPASPNHPYRAELPQHRGGTVVFSDWEFPDSFNMLTATAATDLRVGGLAFSPLWGLDSTLKPYPDLVREVPTVENGDVKVAPDGHSMTVDVKLVPNLRWSDGQPITADDVIFTWEAICDPATQAAATVGFDHIRSMTKVSATELIWNFGPVPRGWCGAPVALSSGVYAPYLQLGPAMWLVPRHRLLPIPHAAWVSDPFFGKPDVVSGPFMVTQIVTNDRITLNANPHYADGRSAPRAYTDNATSVRFTHRAYLDQLVYRVYGDKGAMIDGLKGGETDIGFHLNSDDVPGLHSLAGSGTVTIGGLEDEFLNPNHDVNTATHQRPPWVTPQGDDAPLLEALSIGIDRTALVGRVMNGAARVSQGIYPSALRAYADPKVSAHLHYELDAAKRMLDDDGWAAGPDGIRQKNGRRLQFSLLTVCSNLQRAKELDALKSAWRQLGASVKADCRKRAIFFASFADGGINATGAFDMTVYSNTWQPDPSSWAPVGESSQIPSPSNPSGENWNRCRDPALDRAFAAGEATLLQPERRDAYLQVQQQWLADHCTIPLFEWPQVDQVSRKLHNFAPNPSVSMDIWNAADWWIPAQ